MTILQVDEAMAERLAPLVADFRVALLSYKGIAALPDAEAGKKEILEFLSAGFPVFAAEEAGRIEGYIVCRIQDGLLWVEQLFVREDCRRRGVASLLFAKAEALARSLGEDTVFNYVHPNYDGVIRFLRAKGYTVLNLIEIRRPYAGERLSTTIRVGGNNFDY